MAERNFGTVLAVDHNPTLAVLSYPDAKALGLGIPMIPFGERADSGISEISHGFSTPLGGGAMLYLGALCADKTQDLLGVGSNFFHYVHL